jgi:hypothetical protein
MIASLLTITVITVMTAGSAALYLLPLLIGLVRRLPDIGSLAVVNILLGWTLVGWVAALAMALRSIHPVPPTVQVVQNFPAAQPWPTPLASAGWAGPPGPTAPRQGNPPPLILPPPTEQPDYADYTDHGGVSG